MSHIIPNYTGDDFINQMKTIILQSGNIVMKEYDSPAPGSVVKKEDQSPLTKADLAVHQYLCDTLKESFGIPVISEESRHPSNLLNTFKTFFIIDPIDGTKEFIKKSGEFTVNIGLVVNGKIVAGYIFAPQEGTLWYSTDGMSAVKMTVHDDRRVISVSDRSVGRIGLTSRDHVLKKDLGILYELGCSKILQRGSSLKFCMVAEGVADLYVRIGRTMAWDTTAADIIVRGAGGYMYYLHENGTIDTTPDKVSNFGFVCSNNAIDDASITTIKNLIF